MLFRSSGRMLATHALAVYEMLNARPPKALASIALLFVQAASFGVAAIVGVLLVIDQHGGGLGNFLTTAASQPRNEFRCGAVASWNVAKAPDWKSRTLVVGAFKTEAMAKAAFQSATNQLPETSAALWFGNSVALSLTPRDEALKDKWYDRLQEGASNVFVLRTNHPFSMR